jgi:hypothetical protein
MKDPTNVPHKKCEESVVVYCIYGLGASVFNSIITLKVCEW